MIVCNLKPGQKALAACLVIAQLAGCAAFPTSVDTLPIREDVSGDLDKKWASLPAVKYVTSQTGTSVRKRKQLPANIAREPLSFNFRAKASVSEFVAALETKGVRAILKVGAAKRDERMQLSNYEGTVGEAMEMLALIHDLDYEYLDGVILLTHGVRYMVTVPQNKELMDRIPAALTGLGAANVKTDIDSGLVTYEASSNVRRDVDLYLERMANNASMVALQVAVIDVRLNRDAGSGFDWNEFSAKWGTALDAKPTTPTTPGQTPTSPATSVAGAVATVVAERVLGSVASLNGGGFGLKFDDAKFSLVAAVKMLSKYGKAQTNQDVLISTLSGAPVKISSGSQIPYVSGVGAVAAVGGAVAGSVNTSTVNSGLKIDIVPRYDASEHLVVTNVKAKLSSLVRFRELSAGNTVGTISQPEIQELEFENISRMRPGEIIMLGGISYDQVSESYTSLSGMEKAKLGSEALTTNRHAIFIVIRPSVTIFGQSSGERVLSPQAPAPQSQIAAPAAARAPVFQAPPLPLPVPTSGSQFAPPPSAFALMSQPTPSPRPTIVAPGDVQEFSGDATDLLRGIATQHSLELEISGDGRPLPIRMRTLNRNLRSLLTEIGTQVGGRAELVLTNTHVKLRYRRDEAR